MADNRTMTDAQKAGASARAVGASFTSNPYCKAQAMPAKTGQNIKEWERLALAWELGWRMEDLLDG